MKAKDKKDTGSSLFGPGPHGMMSFSYARVLLPLADAHKIQEILTRAVLIERAYRKGAAPDVAYLMEFDIPGVEVLPESKKHAFDCRGMDKDKVRQWASAVREADEGDAVMSPQEFAALVKEE